MFFLNIISGWNVLTKEMILCLFISALICYLLNWATKPFVVYKYVWLYINFVIHSHHHVKLIVDILNTIFPNFLWQWNLVRIWRMEKHMKRLWRCFSYRWCPWIITKWVVSDVFTIFDTYYILWAVGRRKGG